MVKVILAHAQLEFVNWATNVSTNCAVQQFRHLHIVLMVHCLSNDVLLNQTRYNVLQDISVWMVVAALPLEREENKVFGIIQ